MISATPNENCLIDVKRGAHKPAAILQRQAAWHWCVCLARSLTLDMHETLKMKMVRNRWAINLMCSLRICAARPKQIHQDVLCEAQSFGQLRNMDVHHTAQWVDYDLGLLVHIRDSLRSGGQYNFSLVKKHHLHDLVTELEHDGMPISRPLLHIRYLAGISTRYLTGYAHSGNI